MVENPPLPKDIEAVLDRCVGEMRERLVKELRVAETEAEKLEILARFSREIGDVRGKVSGRAGISIGQRWALIAAGLAVFGAGAATASLWPKSQAVTTATFDAPKGDEEGAAAGVAAAAVGGTGDAAAATPGVINAVIEAAEADNKAVSRSINRIPQETTRSFTITHFTDRVTKLTAELKRTDISDAQRTRMLSDLEKAKSKLRAHGVDPEKIIASPSGGTAGATESTSDVGAPEMPKGERRTLLIKAYLKATAEEIPVLKAKLVGLEVPDLVLNAFKSGNFDEAALDATQALEIDYEAVYR